MYGTRVNNKGKTEKNKKVKEGPCIFPFKYKFKQHNECIDSPTGKKWTTSVNENNTSLIKRKNLEIKNLFSKLGIFLIG